jgi:ABC-type Fe3+/spermidine/putrescine transport system ATPase subunit
VSAYLRLDGLGVRFSSTVTIGPVSLDLAQGEILALLGPSGSGKTTLLRLLAGFEHPDFGRVVIEGEDVTPVPPARRRVGMVFQHYALFPHLDVGANVAFGLSPERRHGAARDAQVSEALALVDLAGFERRRIQELSGGQQQRVALARALAPAPRVLLLDEPLSNLDPSLRERTRRELRQVIKRVGITAVFVTHEQEEAFDLGDRIAVLNGGQLQQVGTAEDLYERPTSLFVGMFVGRANVLRGEAAAALGAGPGQLVLVRPEDLRIEAGGAGKNGKLGGVVTERRYTGAAAFFQVTTSGGVRVEVLADPHAAEVGGAVTLVAVRHLVFPDGPFDRAVSGREPPA